MSINLKSALFLVFLTTPIEYVYSNNSKLTPKQRAALVRQYKIASTNKSFKTRITDSINYYNQIKFSKRPSSVHPKAPSWLKSASRKWIYSTGKIYYGPDNPQSTSCDSTIAAYVSDWKNIVYCPVGMKRPIQMMATLLHEIRHVAYGTAIEGIPHYECNNGGLEPGTIRCDETIYQDPADPRNGAFAFTVYYYHTLYKMGLNVSQFEKSVAKHSGEYYLNGYINNITPNRIYKKVGNYWSFR